MININRSPYKASLTREQFLFHEMRTTAKLMTGGLDENEIAHKIANDNLFQYPTEKSVKRMVRLCIDRLKGLNNDTLVEAIVHESFSTAKQICLYAMMKHSRLVWDFMVKVIGGKFRENDLTFKRIDLNVFFMNLQEQDDNVATWSDSTIQKIKQVLVKILAENDYLESVKATRLQPIFISSVLKNAIQLSGDKMALPAFNCIE